MRRASDGRSWRFGLNAKESLPSLLVGAASRSNGQSTPRLKIVSLRFGSTRRNWLQRLLADACELCGSKESIEVHHVRALKDLMRKGRSERPLWARLMAARRRKTLVLCRPCHVKIHAGGSQRASGALDTGEPDDAKVSSPVRRGPTEKACTSRTSPAAYPSLKRCERNIRCR